MRHDTPHESAGKTVTVTTAQPLFFQKGASVAARVEDWWDRVSGGSWMDATGNAACLDFAVRSAVCGLPTDDEVLYVKTGDGRGHLAHVSEVSAAADGQVAS